MTRRLSALWGLLALLLAACDTTLTPGPSLLVLEAFVTSTPAERPVILRQTSPLSEASSADGAFVSAATLTLEYPGGTAVLAPISGLPGHYAWPDGLTLPPRTAFRLRAQWQDQEATATGTVPPPIRLDSTRVQFPETPVQAILLDSLLAGLDSLTLNTGIRQGFVYPVVVTLWWHPDGDGADADSLYWVQTRLQPRIPISSSLTNYFLLTEQTLLENTFTRDANGQRHWTGVYAVPVASAEAPFPEHELEVTLLRSGLDYARFATSRNAPNRREPLSNVQGGLGIVAGISLNALRLPLAPEATH